MEPIYCQSCGMPLISAKATQKKKRLPVCNIIFLN